jgi:hypothetical protein
MGVGLLEFKVFVEDKPGELARVTEALASNAVNIRAISSESVHDRPFLRIVTNDVNSTRSALRNAGLKFEEEEIVVADLLDRPGELAKIARRLARAGVNVNSIFILGSRNGRTEVAMTVDNREKVKNLLRAE